MDYGMNAPAKEYDGVNKYIRITDIDENSSEYSCANIVSPDGALSDKYLVNKNDILFARTGSSTGKTYLYRPADGRLYFAGFLIRANVKDDNDSNFIYYQCKLKRYWNWVRIMSARSGQPGINSQEYSAYTIYSTSKDEQIKISSLLTLLDERIATQRRLIEDLEKLKSSIIERYFTLQSNTKIKLGDIGSFIRGITYSAEDVTDDETAITIIRANNLNYGRDVNGINVVYITKIPSEKQLLRKGDIAICMANGSSSLVGKNSYYPHDDKKSTIGAFCGIYRSPNPLVRWYMQSNAYKRQIYHSLQGGNGAIANLNSEDILNITIPLISAEKVPTIVSALNNIEYSVRINVRLLDLLNKKRTYLLQRMFI